MTELNLSRQANLVPADKIKQYDIKVFGVGSIGSPVAKLLAKSGFKNITVYDNDIVEEENIAAQEYDFKHINMNKVNAIKDIIKEATGIEIEAEHGFINKDTLIDGEPNTIYACFFDSFEGRKTIWNKIKDLPTIFVDSRIGRYDIRHYLVDCSDQEQKEKYEKTLGNDEGNNLLCGEKASISINYQLAGRVVMNIIRFISEKDYVKTFIGNTTMPINDIVIMEKNEVEE